MTSIQLETTLQNMSNLLLKVAEATSYLLDQTAAEHDPHALAEAVRLSSDTLQQNIDSFFPNQKNRTQK